MSSIYPASDELLHKVRRACIAATPKDTGNLAYNALVVHKIPQGFSVRYKGSVAGYGAILNDFRKQRGWASGKINPHYLWFDSKVQNNVHNELVYHFNGKYGKKPTRYIAGTSRTFQGSAQPRHRVANDGTVEQINSHAELQQLETLKDWNSRYEQFKNHNEKGWAK